MKITDVIAYAYKRPQPHDRPTDAPRDGDYYVRLGLPTLYSVNNEATLVRIETDTGVVGWGECLAPVVPDAVAGIIAQLLRPLLIGADPRDVAVLWDRMYDAMRVRGHLTGLYIDACAAVDVALWDLFGRATGQPISRLLGGRYRERLRLYHSGVPGDSPAARAEEARALVAQGFDALKIHLPAFPPAEVVATVAAVRAAVGPDIALMIDGHWQYAVSEARWIGEQVAPYDVRFFEAPIAPEDTAGQAALAQALTVPIAIGEGERTRWQFLHLLQMRAVGVAQPDIGRTGLTEGKRIATLTGSFNVPLAPHISTGLGIRFAATVQFAAAARNFLILEYQGKHIEEINASLTAPFIIQSGSVTVPDSPGLGVEVDETALAPYMSIYHA